MPIAVEHGAHRGDHGDQMNCVDEGDLCRRDDRSGQVAWERLRNRQGATERVRARSTRLGRDGGRQAVASSRPVERDADAAEDRDAERAAELGARLGDARRGAGPLRRGATRRSARSSARTPGRARAR